MSSRWAHARAAARQPPALLLDRQATRSAILDAAMVLFSRKGYAATSPAVPAPMTSSPLSDWLT